MFLAIFETPLNQATFYCKINAAFWAEERDFF